MVMGRWRPMAGLLMLLLAPAVVSAQTIVDRVVALVGDQVITLSDVRAARDFGLLEGRPFQSDAAETSPTETSPVTGAVEHGLVPPASPLTEAQIVERLVERELMRVEVERFGTGEPATADLDARLRAARARFASPAAFQAALEAHGLSEARFRAWLADDARIEQYIQQRFGLSAQPTDEEVLQYYQSREREFAVDGRPRAFAEVRDLVSRRLLESRREAMVDDWVTGLRRRTAVVLKTID